MMRRLMATPPSRTVGKGCMESSSLCLDPLRGSPEVAPYGAPQSKRPAKMPSGPREATEWICENLADSSRHAPPFPPVSKTTHKRSDVVCRAVSLFAPVTLGGLSRLKADPFTFQYTL